jgi:hypothetical protein
VNQFWDIAVNQLLAGDLDLAADPIMVGAWQAVTFEPYQETLSDLGTDGVPVSTPAVALPGRVVANRLLTADPVTFAAIDEDEQLAFLVLYRSDTNVLVALIDQRPDLAPLFLEGNGGPVTVTWGGTDGRAVISL